MSIVVDDTFVHSIADLPRVDDAYEKHEAVTINVVRWRPKAQRFDAVQPAAPVRPAPDESRLAQRPQVLGHLGLRH